jgi:outer membrane protein assembly factor BamA
MKVNCGTGLRSVVAAAALFGVTLAHAQSPQNAQLPPAAETPAVTGQPVVAVRIVTEDGRVVSEAPDKVGVEIGKALDRARIAESIRRLYRGGEYADVRAESTPVADGIRVDFVVREQLYFNRVVIHGLVSPPSEASAVAAMQLPLGEPYQRETVNEGLERLR